MFSNIHLIVLPHASSSYYSLTVDHDHCFRCAISHTHTHTIFCWDFCFSSCSALSVSQWYRGVFQLSHIMVQYDYFVCPVGYDEVNNRISMECERSPTFILTEYHLPETLRTLFSLVIEAYIHDHSAAALGSFQTT